MIGDPADNDLFDLCEVPFRFFRRGGRRIVAVLAESWLGCVEDDARMPPICLRRTGNRPRLLLGTARMKRAHVNQIRKKGETV